MESELRREPENIGRFDALFAKKTGDVVRINKRTWTATTEEDMIAAAEKPQWLPPGWYDAMLKQMTEWVDVTRGIQP